MQVSFRGLRLVDLKTADKLTLDNSQVRGIENAPDGDSYLLRYRSGGETKTAKIAPNAIMSSQNRENELFRLETALLKGMSDSTALVSIIADINFDVKA
ncbi:MAG: hypothetical protein PHX18_05930 [Candidatus Gastranaerophilales bacterium]|nr:hypothetical protein [Candidatus Gastranaerophilales bacterium]